MIIKGKGGIEVENILTSSSGYSDIPPIRTLRLKFPRFLLPAFSKHTLFRFNGVSNRAVNTEKMLEKMEQNPMVPFCFGKAKKGMSGELGHEFKVTDVGGYNGYQPLFEEGNDEVGYRDYLTPEECWNEAKGWASAYAYSMYKAEIHQELPSRLLEPFMHTEIIMTATEFDNYFNLRIDPDAQGEFQELAKCMKECLDSSEVVPLRKGWHLPMVTDEEVEQYSIDDLKKLSGARVATISYFNHKGDLMTPDKAKGLYNHLVTANKPHLSPVEQQARPIKPTEYSLMKASQMPWLEAFQQGEISEGELKRRIVQSEFFGAFKGWISNRYELESIWLGSDQLP